MTMFYLLASCCIGILLCYKGMKWINNDKQKFVDTLSQEGRVSKVDNVLFIDQNLDNKSIRKLKYISQTENWEAVVESEINSDQYKKLSAMVEEFPSLGKSIGGIDTVTDKLFSELLREYDLLVKKDVLTNIAKTATN